MLTRDKNDKCDYLLRRKGNSAYIKQLMTAKHGVIGKTCFGCSRDDTVIMSNDFNRNLLE